jgi:hypothetical protein
MTPPPITATRIPSLLFRRDAGDGLPRLHRVADFQQELSDCARDGGGDLCIDLVRVRLHQRLALSHAIAALLALRADGDLLRALKVGHHDLANLDIHTPIV